jgi:hypothetical protein
MPLRKMFMAAWLSFISLVPSFSSDLSIISYTTNSVQINWNLSGLEIVDYPVKDVLYKSVKINNALYVNNPGKPKIPYRSFILAIPEGAKVTCTLEITESETMVDILPEPIVTPKRDRSNMIYYDFIVDIADYNFIPVHTIELSAQQYFRSMPVIRVNFFPISYNHRDKTIKIIRNATIRFMFTESIQKGSALLSPSKLDYLYEKIIVNYDQAKNWFAQKPAGLKKVLDIPGGPWYRIEISEDGLYKISRQVLESAGIIVANLDPDRIRIYNNGGMHLNVNTLSDENNPAGPVENARYISKRNDGSFDYLIFYGKQLGGWYYSETDNDFKYQNHLYDLKNYYWLAIGDQQGKNMSTLMSSGLSSTYDETYFMDQKHYEEDSYNLLKSGSEWYGHRFFGLSASETFDDYILDYWQGNSAQATVKIRFKSGNNILINSEDEASCRYYFTVNLNQNPILINKYLSDRVSTIFPYSSSASDFLVNGTNTINIQYRGNREDCVAYLDWIEFYYPRKLTAKEDFLEFYTNHLGEIVHYRVDGFKKTDLALFDISNPTDVKLINTSGIMENGVYSFNLDLRDNIHRKFIISSLTSSNITEITTISAYSPTKNLLATNNGADFIIITPSIFMEYAQELVELRAQLNPALMTTIVDIQDIYFYFNNGVQDPVAIRNFIRYAYYNWQNPRPSYVLFFGDGHYDYRNINIKDSNHIPPFEISSDDEIHSRTTDVFYVDVDFHASNFDEFVPDMAFGRLPVDDTEHARNIIDKLRAYEFNKSRDSWQTVLTFVADDELNHDKPELIEWHHQAETDTVARLKQIKKFLIKKIYLSAYDRVPGGALWIKPDANKAIINQLNEGTLIITYFGHGNSQNWAHESALNSDRDLPLIQNEGKLALFIAGTCSFGIYDGNPADPASFSESLILKEKTGAIGVISSVRAVYPDPNARLVESLLINLFPDGKPSIPVGDGYLQGILGSVGENAQKFHLFADPTMYLADPRNNVKITFIEPDSLKSLSKVKVQGEIFHAASEEKWSDFNGGAMMVVNDARYDSVYTGGGLYYSKIGARLFKGEISVKDGFFTGEFIVPKSIRYSNESTGRISVYAWNESTPGDAFGFIDTLTFNGSQRIKDDTGPEIKVYFKEQENFTDGDYVSKNPVIIAEIFDKNGINLTQEAGHTIDIKIDDQPPLDATLFFLYDRDSCTTGKLTYHLDNLEAGFHKIILKAWDNVNNSSEKEVSFIIAASSGIVLENVVNFPNPFSNGTEFTFQIQGINNHGEVIVKIYTIAGRLIKTIGPEPVVLGFNSIYWNGKDEDDDAIANGVYLYKVILRSDQEQKEKIEKLVKIR